MVVETFSCSKMKYADTNFRKKRAQTFSNRNTFTNLRNYNVFLENPGHLVAEDICRSAHGGCAYFINDNLLVNGSRISC